MPTFVIREKFFGYNDEVFYVAGNRIANIFQDQALAEQHYKQLEIVAARNFALYEVASFFDATEMNCKSMMILCFHVVENILSRRGIFLKMFCPQV